DTFKREFVSGRLAPLDAGQTMAQMAPASVRMMSGPNTSAKDLAFMESLMSETPEDAYRAAIEYLVTFDQRAAQEHYAMPCLLIGGEDDPASPARTMEKMASKIPNAEIHVFPGRHMTPVEQAEAVNPVIRAFLDRIDP
ncbi:MAG: alpha/beta hydrolase, partial [Pseudomonadota bacterium]